MSTPDQKIGIDIPTRASSMLAASTGVPLCTAETTPSAMPMTEASTMATRASSTVAGKRLMISCATGVFV